VVKRIDFLFAIERETLSKLAFSLIVCHIDRSGSLNRSDRLSSQRPRPKERLTGKFVQITLAGWELYRKPHASACNYITEALNPCV
jgi:hypothetical protein